MVPPKRLNFCSFYLTYLEVQAAPRIASFAIPKACIERSRSHDVIQDLQR
jgi:hypothetical protein